MSLVPLVLLVMALLAATPATPAATSVTLMVTLTDRVVAVEAVTAVTWDVDLTDLTDLTDLGRSSEPSANLRDKMFHLWVVGRFWRRHTGQGRKRRLCASTILTHQRHTLGPPPRPTRPPMRLVTLQPIIMFQPAVESTTTTNQLTN